MKINLNPFLEIWEPCRGLNFCRTFFTFQYHVSRIVTGHSLQENRGEFSGRSITLIRRDGQLRIPVLLNFYPSTFTIFTSLTFPQTWLTLSSSNRYAKSNGLTGGLNISKSVNLIELYVTTLVLLLLTFWI